MKTAFTRKSGNKKVGKIATVKVEKKSCPPSCGLYNVCYGKTGPISWHWDDVENLPESSWDSTMHQIAALPINAKWRYGEVGDLPGDGEKIDRKKLRQLVKANEGKRNITYTHKHRYAHQRKTLKWLYDKMKFTFNLSADNLDHADKLADLEIAPVTVTLPWTFKGHKTTTKKGRVVKVCPAQLVEDMNCEKCMICAKRDRDTIVGFVAHGARKRRIT